MRAVRNVADNGRTVCVTIHQPSIEIFEAFDTLLLIQRGGRVTYFGPIGEHSADLIGYLSSAPGEEAWKVYGNGARRTRSLPWR
eukprot:350146-Chlamydomonas_euryale.AAC.4